MHVEVRSDVDKIHYSDVDGAEHLLRLLASRQRTQARLRCGYKLDVVLSSHFLLAVLEDDSVHVGAAEIRTANTGQETGAGRRQRSYTARSVRMANGEHHDVHRLSGLRECRRMLHMVRGGHCRESIHQLQRTTASNGGGVVHRLALLWRVAWRNRHYDSGVRCLWLSGSPEADQTTQHHGRHMLSRELRFGSVEADVHMETAIGRGRGKACLAV